MQEAEKEAAAANADLMLLAVQLCWFTVHVWCVLCSIV